MHLPEGNFTGNDTTLEIILFEVPSNRHSSTGGVGVVGRECPRAKAEFKKQCIDPESTSVQMGIGWRWSRAYTRGETRGIQRELGLERVDALRCIGLVVVQMSLNNSQFVLSLGSCALVFREVLGEQSLLFLQSR